MTVRSNFGFYNAGTFIPFVCNITAVTRGLPTFVTTDVTHGFVVGNTVYFSIPPQWGIPQLNGLTGLILAVTSNTISVNIDSRNFDAFVTPIVTPPQVINAAQVLPVGDQNSGYSVGATTPPLQIPGTFRNTYP
jgi:hypothetical protein